MARHRHEEVGHTMLHKSHVLVVTGSRWRDAIRVASRPRYIGESKVGMETDAFAIADCMGPPGGATAAGGALRGSCLCGYSLVAHRNAFRWLIVL